MKKNIIDNLNTLRCVPANPFAFLWEALYGFRIWAAAGILGTFILSLSKILLPVFFSGMVEYFSVITPQNYSWSKISFFLLQIMTVFLLTSLMRFIREYIEDVYVRSPLRIKLALFGVEYIAGHSENYMSGQKAGQISQKIIGLKLNSSKLHFLISRMTSCSFLLLITFYYIGRVNIFFVVITVIVGTISCYYSYKKSFVLKEINRKVNDTFDQYKGTVVDSIANTLIVKMFGHEKDERNIVMKKFDKALDIRMNEIVTMQNIIMLQRALLAFFELSCALTALYLWYRQKISVGDVALVLLLMGQALMNFMRFWEEVTQLNRVYGEVSSSLAPFLVRHEISDAPKAKKLKVTKGAVKFDNICFSYDGRRNVLENFSLEIKPKEKIGIVGKSGSGKSTLINLLQHFFQLNHGMITVDGQNIAKVKQNTLFENIAVIPQDTSLFHRTVKQNIAYGKNKADDKEIIKAAQKAYADEFIKLLPQGYSTLVGERGIKLSGGQRQRIAIARAILKNSPILILDEATSALDSDSEEKISKSMKTLMKGKTVIAIAHRLSTLKEMDRIVVMENGKIIEEGTPEELLDRGGQFAKLWNLQTV